MVKWLTRFVNNEPEYEGFDEENLGNSLAAVIDEPLEPAPVRKPQLKSLLVNYDSSIENQIMNLHEEQLELEAEIAKLSQVLFETKAAIGGLSLARSSWSSSLPKPKTEDPNERLQEELTKRRNGTEATPTDKPIPMAEG